MASFSKATDYLMGTDCPWNGHFLLRVPPSFDTSCFADDNAKIEFATQENKQVMIVNGKTHSMTTTKLKKHVDVSLPHRHPKEPDSQVMMKAADIFEMALIDGAVGPVDDDIRFRPQWSESDHLKAVETAQKLIKSREMIYWEEEEVDESVYLKRLETCPESIWTADNPIGQGVIIEAKKPKKDDDPAASNDSD